MLVQLIWLEQMTLKSFSRSRQDYSFLRKWRANYPAKFSRPRNKSAYNCAAL
jgi:hypothetical protein